MSEAFRTAKLARQFPGAGGLVATKVKAKQVRNNAQVRPRVHDLQSHSFRRRLSESRYNLAVARKECIPVRTPNKADATHVIGQYPCGTALQLILTKIERMVPTTFPTMKPSMNDAKNPATAIQRVVFMLPDELGGKRREVSGATTARSVACRSGHSTYERSVDRQR